MNDILVVNAERRLGREYKGMLSTPAPCVLGALSGYS